MNLSITFYCELAALLTCVLYFLRSRNLSNRFLQSLLLLLLTTVSVETAGTLLAIRGLAAAHGFLYSLFALVNFVLVSIVIYNSELIAHFRKAHLLVSGLFSVAIVAVLLLAPPADMVNSTAITLKYIGFFLLALLALKAYADNREGKKVTSYPGFFFSMGLLFLGVSHVIRFSLFRPIHNTPELKAYATLLSTVPNILYYALICVAIICVRKSQDSFYRPSLS